MHMALTHAGVADLHEGRLAAHILDGRAPNVTHRRAQSASELVDDVAQGAAIRNAAFDAFGHELVGVGRILEITVLAALLHRADRAHAAIALVAAALEQFDLARRFLGARKQAADHHRRCASCNRFRDIARIADAAIGDQRNAILQCFGDHCDRGDLRHTDASNNPRRADRTGADADLHRIRARIHQCERGVAGHDVAADHLHVREILLDPCDAIKHALRMTVRGIDHDHVDARVDQRFDARFGVATDADRCADAQALGGILCRVGIVARLLDVLDGDQPAQLEGVVDDEHFLDAVLVQQREHFLVRRAFTHGHKPIFLGHDVADRIVELLLEAHVAAGHDADELVALHHRHAGDIARAGELEDFADGRLGADREWFADHACFEVFHLRNMRGLRGDRHVLVQDADTAELRHRDREARFGDGVHRRSNDRKIQRKASGEAGAEADIPRQDDRVRRHQRNVVESQRFGQDAQHGRLRVMKRAIIPVHPSPCCRFLHAGLAPTPASGAQRDLQHQRAKRRKNSSCLKLVAKHHQLLPQLPACSASASPPSSALLHREPA